MSVMTNDLVICFHTPTREFRPKSVLLRISMRYPVIVGHTDTGDAQNRRALSRQSTGSRISKLKFEFQILIFKTTVCILFLIVIITTCEIL